MSHFIKSPNEYDSEKAAGIDFDDAIKLPAGGSTCDIYRTRWQRRDVFVKRLKEEYRAKPIYLDTLDKEFDIGVSLKHPSLPEYREFHRDYIVMDYIDGQTLDEMLRREDPWLGKEKNIRRLLTELVDVVGYLHRHNVVHCDIKPDNIIITSNHKNLVLIDFDKSYSDALNDTSGHPCAYGLPIAEAGRVLIDFHAIALLAERLKNNVKGFRFHAYKKFIRACHRPDVSCEELREILVGRRRKPSALRVMAWIISSTLLIGVGVYVVERIETAGEKKESVMEVPVAATMANQTPSIERLGDERTENETLATVHPTVKTQKDIHTDARQRASVLDQRIQPEFDVLLAGLDHLKGIRNDERFSGQQLLDSIRHHNDLADEYIKEAFEILKESNPNLTDREAWRIMSYSKAYTGYTRRAAPELKEFGHEVERRFAKEGIPIDR